MNIIFYYIFFNVIAGTKGRGYMFHENSNKVKAII